MSDPSATPTATSIGDLPFSEAGVLGAGSWGTALAIVLAERGFSITLYGNDEKVRDEANTFHTNEMYLPGIKLPDSIRATTEIHEVSGKPLNLLVVPSQVARLVLTGLQKAGLAEGSILVCCTKGIEAESGKRMHELAAELFPRHPVAVLSGPSHAEEVAQKMATAAVIGAEDFQLAELLQDIFTLPWFRTYTSTDIGGIEVGGTVKNVFAIAAGIVDGLGLGDNAKAAMVTRGLAEMTRLGVALGGDPETFRGLSGMGDLIVTCYSHHSRNNRVGRMLGEGKTLDEAIASMNMVAEGVPNAESVYKLSKKLGVSTPIIDQIYAVLYQGKPTAQALQELFSRDPKPEAEG